MLIALSNFPINEFEILNTILLDPKCKYTNFATFLELLSSDIPIVNNLKIKLSSINNVASNVSINGSTEFYPDINQITLYDNCSIQLVNNYSSWSNFIRSFIIFNRFSTKTKTQSTDRIIIRSDQLLSTTVSIVPFG